MRASFSLHNSSAHQPHPRGAFYCIGSNFLCNKKVDNLSPTLETCSQRQKAPQTLENTAFFTVNKAPDLV